MTKQPQDHKPKQQPGILTVTVRGTDLHIPLDALDDFELLEDLSEAQSLADRADDDPDAAGRAAQISLSTLRRLLPPAEMAKAKNVLRDPETGRVKASDMLPLVGEIFEAAKNPNS
jgi:hypothetical protein